MANPAGDSSKEISSLSNTLSTFLNRDLQQVCLQNNLGKTGVKAELQRRIVNALNETIHSDHAQYTQIRASIQNMAGGRVNQHHGNGSVAAAARGGGAYSVNGGHHMPTHVPQPAYGQNGYGYGQGRGGYGGGASSSVPPKKVLHFKNSPFYMIESMIGDVKLCSEMTQHRNSIHITLKTNEFRDAGRFGSDPNLRVMVLCADDESGIQEISFPHQSELKVNGGDIKANLRGLKGKPGSTRPVDITSSLRLDKASYVNNIEFTYALTSRKFFLALYLCQTVPVQDLVAKIKGKKIARASVIQELTKAAHDPDIVATSQVLSLKCPLSYMRLNVPCRSVSCNHIQCFDATSYLQLQEQGPQWICPICNKPAPFESLAVDEYAKDILDHTTESTEQVTIEPDGHWRAQSDDEPEPKQQRDSGVVASILDDDDDIVALDNWVSSSARNTQTPNPSMIGTPASNRAPASTNGAPAVNGSGTKKRPAEVIDLTLSDDDDDDEPIVRAPKRQYQGPTPTPSSVPGLTFPGFHFS